MKFVYHRGGFKESMDTVFEFFGKQELFEILKKDFQDMYGDYFPHLVPNFEIDKIKCKYIGYDDRNGWNTHYIILDGFGVLGYTDTEI